VIRREEAIRAAAVLGAEPPVFLEHPDLELALLPPGLLREQFVRLIRQYKPDVVIAEDPLYIAEVHPDHRAVARAASDAVNFCHLPLFYPEHMDEGLEPHFVVEKYFYTPDPAGANKIVDITDTIEKKIAAMAEHKSQVRFLVEEVVRQAQLAGLDLKAILGPMVEDPAAAMARPSAMSAVIRRDIVPLSGSLTAEKPPGHRANPGQSTASHSSQVLCPTDPHPG
jgi:LmbE family N-acetylglucosaminyl deacetylase